LQAASQPYLYAMVLNKALQVNLGQPASSLCYCCCCCCHPLQRVPSLFLAAAISQLANCLCGARGQPSYTMQRSMPTCQYPTGVPGVHTARNLLQFTSLYRSEETNQVGETRATEHALYRPVWPMRTAIEALPHKRTRFLAQLLHAHNIRHVFCKKHRSSLSPHTIDLGHTFLYDILLSGLYPHMWRAFGQHAVAAAWRLCVHDVPSFVLVQKRQADTARLISILLCRVGLWDRTHGTPCPGVCTWMLQASVLQEAFCRLQCSQLLTSSTPASYSCWEHSNQSVVSPNRNVAGLQTDRIWAYLSIFCSVDLLSRQQQHEWRCSTCLSVACCET
jgi:hypothetical protein